MNQFSRREVIAIALQSIGTLYVSGCVSPRAATKSQVSDSFLSSLSPIDRGIQVPGPGNEFLGDRFDRPHRILWNKSAYLAERGIPKEIEHTKLVVLGGGIAGMTSAYLHRHHQPILLEQAARFGGNAKGEQWNGVTYAMGSAYIDKPKAGTPMGKFFDELQLSDLVVERTSPDPVEWKGKLHAQFWDGITEPHHSKRYKRLHQFFAELRNLQEKGYPEIPCLTRSDRDSVDYWDQWTMHQVLSKRLGKLPSHLETLIEHYCWSTYGASSKELSAASALNFLANDSATICVAPGGNAGIAERVLMRSLDTIPKDCFRSGCLVVDVAVDESGVEVLYEDASGKLRRIRSQAAIFAAPKFVAARVIQDLEDSRLDAIRKIPYRAYLVANVLIQQPAKERFYDLYLTGDGRTNFARLDQEAHEQGATDVILANFASPSSENTVLTLYRAVPVDTGRAQLFGENSYALVRKEFENQVQNSILPMLGYSKNKVIDLRITRWGHAIPFARPGTFTSGLVDKLRLPFRKRLFFTEQDNWLKPALKTGVTDAYLQFSQVESMLVDT
jgi:protoporphyrinogen oxidase